MLPHLCVRLPVASDLDQLNALVVHLLDTPDCRHFYHKHYRDKTPAVRVEQAFIAEQHGSIAGFLLWAQDEFLGMVTGIGVKETHRRFGVASLLVTHAVETLRQEGLRVLDVICDSRMAGIVDLFQMHKFRTLSQDGTDVLLTRRLVGGRNRGDGFDA